MKSKPSTTSKKSSFSRSKKDNAPVLTDIGPVFGNFVEAVDYHMHRLKKKLQRFNQHAASNVMRLVKRLRTQLKETKFVENDRVSILNILKGFRDACDCIGVHEAVSMRLCPNLMRKPASSFLSASYPQGNRNPLACTMRGCHHI